MPSITFDEASRIILGEIESTLARMRSDEMEALRRALLQAGAVFVTGEGRSGLVARCFAMRLMHLGLRCHVVGETITPAISNGDLLVAVSGTGETAVTSTLARLAQKHGARVAAVTGSEGSSLASGADLRVVVPAGGGRGEGSQQYGGSLFEQSALIALEAVVLQLQGELGQTKEQMDARHATLE